MLVNKELEIMCTDTAFS